MKCTGICFPSFPNKQACKEADSATGGASATRRWRGGSARFPHMGQSRQARATAPPRRLPCDSGPRRLRKATRQKSVRPVPRLEIRFGRKANPRILTLISDLPVASTENPGSLNESLTRSGSMYFGLCRCDKHLHMPTRLVFNSATHLGRVHKKYPQPR